MSTIKQRIRNIIREQTATVNKNVIDDTVMDVLSDEGGAAGLDPIKSALEDLETEEIGLPDDPIEDIIKKVRGVKRHADGDFVDSTKLESNMRLTRSQLRKIIREECGIMIDKDHGEDQEVGMAINQLQTISATAIELIELIEHLNFVPEWGDGKIATVLDRLNSLRSYMVGKSIGR